MITITQQNLDHFALRQGTNSPIIIRQGGTVQVISQAPAGTGAAPAFAIEAPNAATEGDSGTKVFTFTVTRKGALSVEATVDWATTGSGADASDFVGGVLPSGTLTFGVGESAKTIDIEVQGDTDIEEDEAFTVTLSNGKVTATLITAAAAVNILNDDVDQGATADFYMADTGTGDGRSAANPASFATAWAAASDGQTIKLVGDTTVPKAHTWNKTVKILADPGALDPDFYGDGTGTHPGAFTRTQRLILQPPNAPGSGAITAITKVAAGKFLRLQNIKVAFPYWPATPSDTWESIGVAGQTNTSYWFVPENSTASYEAIGVEYFHGYGPNHEIYDPTFKYPEAASPSKWYFSDNGTITDHSVIPAPSGTTVYDGHGDNDGVYGLWPTYNNIALGPNVFTGAWATFRQIGCWGHDLCEGLSGTVSATGNALIDQCIWERIYGDFMQMGYGGGSDMLGGITVQRTIIMDPMGQGTDALNIHEDIWQLFSNDSGLTSANPRKLRNIRSMNNFMGVSRANVRGGAQLHFWQGSANHNDAAGTNFCAIEAPQLRSIFAVGNFYKAFASDVISDPYVRDSLFVNPDWPTGRTPQALDLSFQRTDLPVQMPDSAGLLYNTIHEGASATLTMRMLNNFDAGLQGSKIPHATLFADPSMPTGVLRPGQLYAKYRPIGAYAGAGPQYATLKEMIDDPLDLTGELPHIGFLNLTDQPTGTQVLSNQFYVYGGDPGDAVPITLPAGVEVQQYGVDRTTVLSAWASGTTTLTVGRYAQLRYTTPSTALTRVNHDIVYAGTHFTWSVKTAAVASFAVVDNQDTAIASVAQPTVLDGGIRKMIVAVRVMHDTAMPSNAQLFGPNGTQTMTRINHTTNGQPYKFNTANSGSAAPFQTAQAPLIGVWETHIIAVDWTKTVADEVVRYVINGVKQTNSSIPDVTGTRVSTVGSLIPSTGLGLFGRADVLTNFFKGKMAFFWMHWGDATLALPDITDEAVQDLFSADYMGANGEGPLGFVPKLFFTGSAAEWNAGMANKGTAVAPLTKATGTFA